MGKRGLERDLVWGGVLGKASAIFVEVSIVERAARRNRDFFPLSPMEEN